MRIATLPDAAEVASAAADRLGTLLDEIAQPVLGLPTGRTMLPFYAELARRHARGAIDLSGARGFNLDELVLPRDHPATFRAFMERHAWERTGLARERCDIPDGAAEPEGECRRYDLALAAAGGLDLAILGVGADGHVAYNLPGAPIDPTHVVELPDALAEQLEAPPAWRPLRALTLGLGALRAARRILLLATTADKARAVRALVEGPADPAWPCSLLRDHSALEVLLTPAAAGGSGATS
ncbi:MAG: glucosamine-6-phosphate deaminase [Acidobacteria bacterium]|nr:glucosamine-6-phosphate deaminase [Acidobacteriota bacterium]